MVFYGSYVIGVDGIYTFNTSKPEEEVVPFQIKSCTTGTPTVNTVATHLERTLTSFGQLFEVFVIVDVLHTDSYDICRKAREIAQKFSKIVYGTNLNYAAISGVISRCQPAAPDQKILVIFDTENLQNCGYLLKRLPDGYQYLRTINVGYAHLKSEVNFLKFLSQYKVDLVALSTDSGLSDVPFANVVLPCKNFADLLHLGAICKARAHDDFGYRESRGLKDFELGMKMQVTRSGSSPLDFLMLPHNTKIPVNSTSSVVVTGKLLMLKVITFSNTTFEAGRIKARIKTILQKRINGRERAQITATLNVDEFGFINVDVNVGLADRSLEGTLPESFFPTLIFADGSESKHQVLKRKLSDSHFDEPPTKLPPKTMKHTYSDVSVCEFKKELSTPTKFKLVDVSPAESPVNEGGKMAVVYNINGVLGFAALEQQYSGILQYESHSLKFNNSKVIDTYNTLQSRLPRLKTDSLTLVVKEKNAQVAEVGNIAKQLRADKVVNQCDALTEFVIYRLQNVLLDKTCFLLVIIHSTMDSYVTIRYLRRNNMSTPFHVATRFVINRQQMCCVINNFSPPSAFTVLLSPFMNEGIAAEFNGVNGSKAPLYVGEFNVAVVEGALMEVKNRRAGMNSVCDADKIVVPYNHLTMECDFVLKFRNLEGKNEECMMLVPDASGKFVRFPNVHGNEWTPIVVSCKNNEIMVGTDAQKVTDPEFYIYDFIAYLKLSRRDFLKSQSASSDKTYEISVFQNDEDPSQVQFTTAKCVMPMSYALCTVITALRKEALTTIQSVRRTSSRIFLDFESFQNLTFTQDMLDVLTYAAKLLQLEVVGFALNSEL